MCWKVVVRRKWFDTVWIIWVRVIMNNNLASKHRAIALMTLDGKKLSIFNWIFLFVINRKEESFRVFLKLTWFIPFSLSETTKDIVLLCFYDCYCRSLVVALFMEGGSSEVMLRASIYSICFWAIFLQQLFHKLTMSCWFDYERTF